MLKQIIFVILSVLSVQVFAQDRTDSTFFYVQSVNSLNLAQANATFLLAGNFQKLGDASVFYKNYSGGYRTTQQAQKTVNAGLSSSGINTFGRFKVSGYFSFTRTWQDSLAWSTKGLEQDDKPYYYGSIKAGSFERINYQLGGVFSYNLIKDKLFLGGGAEYKFNNTTRSVDPRPDVDTYSLKISPEIIYHFKDQYLGIRTKWGYGTEVTSIGFKNLDYANSTTGYPDRVNYFIQGYGLFSNAQGTTEPLRKLEKSYGLGLNYAGRLSNYKINASLNYQNQKEKFYQLLANSLNRNYLGYYDTDLLEANLQIDKQNTNYRSQLFISYSNQKSNDLNTLFNAVNYRYASSNAKLEYLLQLSPKNRTSPEVGVSTLYSKVDKADYSSDHFVGHTWIEPSISGTLYYKINNRNKLSGNLLVGYRTSIDSHLDIPETQQTIFTNWVVFPDFSYYTSSAYKLGSKFQFISSGIFKQFKTGLTVQGTYYKLNKVETTFPTAKRTLGENFINVNLALNLYF